MFTPRLPSPTINDETTLETMQSRMINDMVCTNNGTTSRSETYQGVSLSAMSVPSDVDLNKWMTDNVTRYLLPQLLIAKGGRLDKKLTVEEHVSDAVVWNIVFINTSNDFPIESPTFDMKNNALLFLIEFRKQLNIMLVEEIQNMYLTAANSEEWMALRKTGDNYVSFKDLVDRTAEEMDEVVSKTCSLYFVMTRIYSPFCSIGILNMQLQITT